MRNEKDANGDGSFPLGWDEPPKYLYQLDAFPVIGGSGTCEANQTFELTLDEFQSLKRHLAEMRGYLTQPQNLVVGDKDIATTYFGFDLGDHAGLNVDYSELLLKDADGDQITSWEGTQEFAGILNVLIRDGADQATTVRLLRKITSAIETGGICLDGYAVHTKNPVIGQLEALRARVIATGGRVNGGESVLES